MHSSVALCVLGVAVLAVFAQGNQRFNYKTDNNDINYVIMIFFKTSFSPN